MPLYEYECESCHQRFEKIQKFSDPPEEVCPKCGEHVKKLFSSPAIQFKGSGFYITDYAKKSSSEASQASSSKSSEGSKSSDSGGSSDTAKTETSKSSEPAKPAKSET